MTATATILEIDLRRLRAALMRVATHYTDDTDAADDIVQGVMLRLWERRAELDASDPARVAAYGRRAVVNAFMSECRRNGVRARAHESNRCDIPQPSEDIQPEQAMLLTDDSGVRSVLASLPDHYRAPLEALADGSTYAEIGEAMECPPGTVMSRVHRGRAKARKLLTEVVEITGNSRSVIRRPATAASTRCS